MCSVTMYKCVLSPSTNAWSFGELKFSCSLVDSMFFSMCVSHFVNQRQTTNKQPKNMFFSMRVSHFVNQRQTTNKQPKNMFFSMCVSHFVNQRRCLTMFYTFFPCVFVCYMLRLLNPVTHFACFRFVFVVVFVFVFWLLTRVTHFAPRVIPPPHRACPHSNLAKRWL